MRITLAIFTLLLINMLAIPHQTAAVEVETFTVEYHPDCYPDDGDDESRLIRLTLEDVERLL